MCSNSRIMGQLWRTNQHEQHSGHLLQRGGGRNVSIADLQEAAVIFSTISLASSRNALRSAGQSLPHHKAWQQAS